MEQQSSQPENHIVSKKAENAENVNEAGIDENKAKTRKSRLIRIGFLLLFVVFSTLPVVKGCGVHTVSSADVMTLQLSEKLSNKEDIIPFILVAVPTLWSTVILLAISLFPMKERDSSRLTIGAAVALSVYLLTVLAYANKDVLTSNAISLESGWYLLLVFTGVLYAHKYLLQRLMGGDPAKIGRAEDLPIKSDPETVSGAQKSDPVVSSAAEGEVSPDVQEAVTDNYKEANTTQDRHGMIEEGEYQTALKPKRKKWKIVLGIVGGIVVMVIAVLGILVYLEYSRQQEAIMLVKETEYEGGVWEDYSKQEIENNPTVQYEWSANDMGQDGVYYVAFTDEAGWGQFWEADINENTVKHVNTNQYLLRKYGHSEIDSGEYIVSDIEEDKLKVDVSNSAEGGAKVHYVMKAKAQNKAGKHISDAKMKYRIMMIYENKSITDETPDGYPLFDEPISARIPWSPNEAKRFSFHAVDGLDAAYFREKPAYFVCQLWLETNDLSGYEYWHCIEEIDLLPRWDNIREEIESKGKRQANRENLLDIPEGDGFAVTRLTPVLGELSETLVLPGTYSAPSVLDGNNAGYGVQNLYDNNAKTAFAVRWSDEVKYGTLLSYTSEATALAGVKILNGYCKTTALWQSNARAKEITISTDNYSLNVTLKDTPNWQYIIFPDNIYGSTYTVEVSSIYPGTQYEDLCLSEFVFITEIHSEP